MDFLVIEYILPADTTLPVTVTVYHQPSQLLLVLEWHIGGPAPTAHVLKNIQLGGGGGGGQPTSLGSGNFSVPLSMFSTKLSRTFTRSFDQQGLSWVQVLIAEIHYYKGVVLLLHAQYVRQAVL
jgi:hypothetical protein